jgi:hypothetical protein
MENSFEVEAMTDILDMFNDVGDLYKIKLKSKLTVPPPKYLKEFIELIDKRVDVLLSNED